MGSSSFNITSSQKVLLFYLIFLRSAGYLFNYDHLHILSLCSRQLRSGFKRETNTPHEGGRDGGVSEIVRYVQKRLYGHFSFYSITVGCEDMIQSCYGKELKPFLRYCRVKQMPGPSVFPATNRKQHSGGERKTKPNVFKNGQYPGVAGFAILLSSPPLPFPIPLPFPHRFFVVLCDDLSDGAVVLP